MSVVHQLRRGMVLLCQINMNYRINTSGLSLDEKRELLIRSRAKCFEWWVDILDCSKSFARQRIEMTFDEILAKLTTKCHFTVIVRDLPNKHIEVGFSTMNVVSPNYYLWINLDMINITMFNHLSMG